MGSINKIYLGVINLYKQIFYSINFILIILLFHVNNLTAQSETDSTKNNAMQVFGYPYAFYTPETNFAIGAGGMIYFRTANILDLNLSSILLSGYYTINDQYSLTLTPELYFASNKYIAQGEFNFGKFLDKFYGYGSNSKEIDNPDYFAQDFGINLNFQADIIDNFEIGAIYDFLYTNIIDKKDNLFLLNDAVLGSNGGISSGIGFILVWDSRDYIFLPTNGGFNRFSMVFYSKVIGSDFEFQHYLFDLRRYYKISDDILLTVQLYGNFSGGDPPFYEMPRLGGSKTMRGYYEGRYRDRNYLTAQAEFKTYLIKKWKLLFVAFGGLGDVGHDLNDFLLKEFKYSYGFGFRYIFDKEERLTVRADFGFGKNTTGVYFAMQETF